MSMLPLMDENSAVTKYSIHPDDVNNPLNTEFNPSRDLTSDMLTVPVFGVVLNHVYTSTINIGKF